MIGDRERILTPQPAAPAPMMKVIRQLIEHFQWNGIIGCGYPGVIQNQCTMTAANLDKSWIGHKLGKEIEKITSQEAWVINDADAAGLAEMHFGAGKNKKGVVMMITIGTGLGTALFIDGILLPNTELGHLHLKNGKEAEKIASAAVRKHKNLSWKVWAEHLNKVLEEYERLFNPDLFILGGGYAKKSESFDQYIQLNTPHVFAKMENDAGIIGAALAAKLYL